MSAIALYDYLERLTSLMRAWSASSRWWLSCSRCS